MKKFVLSMMLVMIASPAWSQTKPRAAASGIDPCAPIGQTANRELVYSMSCSKLPTPLPQAPQAGIQQPQEPEAPRSGIFGMSFDRLGGSGGQGRVP